MTKVNKVWAKKAQRSYVSWHWILMQNYHNNWLVLSKMTGEIRKISAGWIKSCDFILESKMVKLNQNKNWKQPDWRDTVQKT